MVMTVVIVCGCFSRRFGMVQRSGQLGELEHAVA